MSKLKHTPGPRKINDNVDFDSFISGPTGKFENVICSSPKSYRWGKNGCKNYEPWHNNKLLISAAPEMLDDLIDEARKQVIRISAVKNIDEFIKNIGKTKIMQTIEKATGLTIEEILNEN